MKEVPKKDVPEISGGYTEGGCIPFPPGFPDIDEGREYPAQPTSPYYLGGSIDDPVVK